MNFDIRELYQEVILDHNRKPRNFRKIEEPTHHAEGYNPLCGDQIEVFLTVHEGIIEDVSFVGEGCAISTASSSMMTEAIKGKPIEEFEKLFDHFHEAVTHEGEIADDLGQLKILTGVRDYPTRVKCATLAWHAINAALNEEQKVVKTE